MLPRSRPWDLRPPSTPFSSTWTAPAWPPTVSGSRPRARGPGGPSPSSGSSRRSLRPAGGFGARRAGIEAHGESSRIIRSGSWARIDPSAICEAIGFSDNGARSCREDSRAPGSRGGSAPDPARPCSAATSVRVLSGHRRARTRPFKAERHGSGFIVGTVQRPKMAAREVSLDSRKVPDRGSDGMRQWIPHVLPTTSTGGWPGRPLRVPIRRTD